MDHTEAAPEPVVRRPLWEQQPAPQPAPAAAVPTPDSTSDGSEAHGPDGLDGSDGLDDEPEQEAVEYPEPPVTGDAEVDAAITALAQAVGGPLEEQLAAFDAAHRTLQDRLADLEG